MVRRRPIPTVTNTKPNARNLAIASFWDRPARTRNHLHQSVPTRMIFNLLADIATRAQLAQQIRGNRSPLSTSTMRVPPTRVFMRTTPGRSAVISPMIAASRPSLRGEAELRGEERAFLPINGATIPGKCATKARPFIPSGFDPDGLAADEGEPVKARGIVLSPAQSRVRTAAAPIAPACGKARRVFPSPRRGKSGASPQSESAR